MRPNELRSVLGDNFPNMGRPVFGVGRYRSENIQQSPSRSSQSRSRQTLTMLLDASRATEPRSISAMNQQLDDTLAHFAGRPLAEAFPYLILDARYERVREAGVIVSQAVLIAIGIDWDGWRQSLPRRKPGCWRSSSPTARAARAGGISC
jgi:hypothetical protein